MNKFAESQAGEINALRLLCDHSLKKSTGAFGSVRLKPTNRSSEANQIGSLARLRRSVVLRASSPVQSRLALRKDEIDQEQAERSLRILRARL